MRALVVYCHPSPQSFTAAVLGVVQETLENAGAQLRVRDLYQSGFDPALSPSEFESYHDSPSNQAVVQSDVDDLKWCDTLIFVYPTWWYGLPATLKGWLDRVLLPDVAFMMPKDQSQNITRGLTHITRLGVFTTCGASWGLTQMMGAPGKRTLMRGAKHLAQVAQKMQRFVGAPHQLPQEATR